MLNFVRNIITFDCDEEEVKKIIDEIKSDDGKTLFDFNKLIPMPEELNILEGSKTDEGITAFETDNKSDPELYELGKQAIKNLEKYGHRSWYYWRVQYWETKWNALDVVVNGNSLIFETAWSTPFPVLKALSCKFPCIPFSVKYADEDIGYDCGEMTFKDGICIDNISYPFRSEEAILFADRVWQRFLIGDGGDI